MISQEKIFNFVTECLGYSTSSYVTFITVQSNDEEHERATEQHNCRPKCCQRSRTKKILTAKLHTLLLLLNISLPTLPFLESQVHIK